MGGDHKCPVCQATFTRPQHVQRHMRSHTGDRPYKCQHCGDQFARSDLLSRHVNKCHANEKPPTTTAPNQRRKGSAAASRATTSKQACDQCVQSSLPCDGSNPCSKCIQRKCRCTYVKFSRQTAPVGPGHQIRHDPGDMLGIGVPGGPGSLAGAFGMDTLGGPRYQDDFLLNPAPGTSHLNPILPSMSLEQLYGQSQANAPQFSFPPLYPQGSPLNYDPTSSAQGQSSAATLDYMTRYRAQADLLRRAGVAVPPPAPGMTTGIVPGLYADNQAQPARYSLSTAAWPTNGAQDPHASNQNGMAYANLAASSRQPQHYDNAPSSMNDQRHSLYASANSSSRQHHDSSNSVSPVPPPSHLTYSPYAQQQQQHSANQQANNSFVNNLHHRDRRQSISMGSDYDSGYEYDSSSQGHGREGSVPSSDTGSSVHLPLHGHSQRSEHGHGQNLSQSTSSSTSGHHNPGSNAVGEGGFSSAFGMMSLDDPNVLAGLSSDAPPFFSNESMHGLLSQGNSNENEPTPMQGPSGKTSSQNNQSLGHNGGLGQMSSRDMETKELKEFWKQYMRTPLTGPGNGGFGGTPGLSGIFAGEHIAGNGSGARPAPPKRGLSRVASLPSVKTPTADLNRTLQPLMLPMNNHNGHHVNGGGDGGESNMRTTLHFADKDDLKSYEQAVLARKGLTNLNLVPRRGRNAGSSGQGQGIRLPPVPVVTGIAGNVSLAARMGGDNSGKTKGAIDVSMNVNNSRPSSAMSGHSGGSGGSGGSSSLANALHDSTSNALAVHSRPGTAQSVQSEGGRGDGDGGDGGGRPSFKRLASQTLGPEFSKRALLSKHTPAGHGPPPLWGRSGDDLGGGSAVADTDGADGDDEEDGDLGDINPRGAVGISDRFRRMSAPTTTRSTNGVHAGYTSSAV